MCGLAGLLDLDGRLEAHELEHVAGRMGATLVHRGPDDAGTFVDPSAGVAMAFRRLAVMDLSVAGHQPMATRDGRVVLTFNGEIYNHAELRRTLTARGWRPRGSGDTEVLVEAVARWGLAGALERVVGMFAIAAWDRGTHTLSLARDRLGEKPLHVARVGRRVLWASEVGAIDAVVPGLTIDRGSLRAYLRFGYVPAPRTIFEEVAVVEPGTIWTVRRDRVREPTVRRYWSLAEAVRTARAEPITEPTEARVERLEHTVLAAVEARLDADVPLGTTLSGGVDSSLVTTAVARLGRTPRTFTVAFGGHAVDEGPHAAAVAAVVGAEHTEIAMAERDALALVPEVASTFDQPFGDPSALPSVLLARVVREHVTVVLGGDGGDELFAGYERYRWASALRSLQRRVGRPGQAAAALLSAPAVPWEVALAVAGRVTTLPPRASPEAAHRAARLLARRDLAAFAVDMVALWRDAERLVPGGHEPAPFAGWLSDRAIDRAEPGLSEVDRLAIADTAVYLPDDLLVKVDRTTMAVGLEGRLPLLDPSLLDLAWRLPEADRSAVGGGKQLVRRLLRRWLPAELVDRPKQGFEVPLDDWLRGPLAPWAGDLLAGGAFDELGLADRPLVRGRWEAHRSGRRRHGYELWSLLQLLAWHEHRQGRSATTSTAATSSSATGIER